MSPVLLIAVLGGGLLVIGLLGPWMLRSASPALVRVPRLAAGLLTAGIVVWLGTALAVGPMLAWVVSGPVVLPERAAEVCQRCLTSASPFTGGTVETVVPAVLLLAVPALAAGLLGAGFLRQMLNRARQSRSLARTTLRGAGRRMLDGHEVSVVADDRPFALAFPARHGGIVVSTGALAVLGRDELRAVLAHESAHLRQRHHAILALVGSLARWMRWVPLIAAAEGALPHYLEIAADDQARREAGTPALVGALLALGERAAPADRGPAVLHAAGPERIAHLVRPETGTAGAPAVVAITAHLGVLGLFSAAVHLPYVSAALNGCV